MISHPEIDEIIFLSSIDSTNLEVQRRRIEFAKRNILLLSDEQTAGKGQHGRSWDSGVGLGLWMSLFLGKPAYLTNNLQLLSLYTGLVIHNTISNFISADVKVKWPNDIMIADRKCGGILTEIQWLGESASSATIGIGINLNHILTDFPASIRNLATSLLLAGWPKPDRDQLLDHLLQEFFGNIRLLSQPENLVETWNSSAYKLNEIIQWQNSDQQFEGRFLGVNPEGEAQILIGNTIRCFQSGEIRFGRLS